MTRREYADRALRLLPTVGWLWLLWIVLWGSVGPLVVLGGLLVAVTVVGFFPLPPALPDAVPRPLAIARLLVNLLKSLLWSGGTVAWQVLRHGGKTSAAIIEVPLRVDSDLLITVVAELTTISPGTLVVEIDRRRRRLYVHALPVRDETALARRRDVVRAVERRVARAVGGDRTNGAAGDDTSGTDAAPGPSGRPGGPPDRPEHGGRTP